MIPGHHIIGLDIVLLGSEYQEIHPYSALQSNEYRHYENQYFPDYDQRMYIQILERDL